jgi:hypothetical protein
MTKTRQLLLLTLITSVMLIMIGCSNEDPFTVYQRNMESYLTQITYYNDAINAIDPESDNAVAELLQNLTGIAETIREMARFDVPPSFPGVAELADQADELMVEALQLFHEAFAGDFYDDNIGNAANEYYQRANLRLRYIAEILQGNMPEGIFEYDPE